MVFTTRYNYLDNDSIFFQKEPIWNNGVAIARSKFRIFCALSDYKSVPQKSALVLKLFNLGTSALDKQKLIDIANSILKYYSDKNISSDTLEALRLHKDKVSSGILASDIMRVINNIKSPTDDDCILSLSKYIVSESDCSICRIDFSTEDCIYHAIALPYLEEGERLYKKQWAESLISLFKTNGKNDEFVLALHGRTDWGSEYTGFLKEESDYYTQLYNLKTYVYLFRHEPQQNDIIAKGLHNKNANLETIWEDIILKQ